MRVVDNEGALGSMRRLPRAGGELVPVRRGAAATDPEPDASGDRVDLSSDARLIRALRAVPAFEAERVEVLDASLDTARQEEIVARIRQRYYEQEQVRQHVVRQLAATFVREMFA